MPDLRSVYAEKALSQIPRLLTLQDRHPFSPTYGCFKRTYWLDKTVDFPDALPQFGVLSLALVYGYDMPAFAPDGASADKPGNMYKGHPKIREWILAGMRFWTEIQHRDGSFDEFYPHEHGWTGPTGFLLYSMLKSYMIFEERNAFPSEFRDQFFHACRKAADYIIHYDENGVLANHHAMAVLPVYYAYHVLRDERFREGYEKKLAEFLSFCDPEGWSLEYDGADIGYLSATVSFLAKVWKLNRDPRLFAVMGKAVDFLSYFVYPNGFFAGSMGSRNTLHFYSHGCELLAPQVPLAGRVADVMLESLRDGKIVPAAIMDDRYFLYRIPEHLESFIDYGERAGFAELPYEREDFRTVFPRGRFYIEKRGSIYLVANAAKGGVLKGFDIRDRREILSDGGIIGRIDQGACGTSQWIDPSSRFEPLDHGLRVAGSLYRIPSHKLFTPLKFIIFRIFLLLFGWHTWMAYTIKGTIRKLLMLRSVRLPISFVRTVEVSENAVHIVDEVRREGAVSLREAHLGGDFVVRYVPQSRYFQAPELDATFHKLTSQECSELRTKGVLRVERTYPVMESMR
ncbi:hypothetical protein HYT95_00615 [Candidatus Peregrinibacteria bacterium]|nr:hypothetical protein [Candidatus Peregrinibacteria bacterium]